MEGVQSATLLDVTNAGVCSIVNARTADIKRADIKRSDTNLPKLPSDRTIDATKHSSPPQRPVSRAIVSGDFRAQMQARVANLSRAIKSFSTGNARNISAPPWPSPCPLGEDCAPAPLRRK